MRSLLEDVGAVAPHRELLKRVKRAAAATDAARDAAILLRLLENNVTSSERELAQPLFERLREKESAATGDACRRLRRARFEP